ncbi:PREDICTED: E3 ubiquitin-protein ligase BOI-like [Camelina sativa]|uniref:E3 ubiquitin-protein ligase BOI-like n=1 Tax=Camelina sativa TaxID=90675 RepID=A0ABM1QMA0_CAMSA|nr:PREDICTED: E3 ubiquitin-protein ligase BOI-like [Camelina sativa]
MALQAHHHPSHSLFLKSNGQEAVDSRKRSREVYSSAVAAPMNPPPSKPPQVIDLSELFQTAPNVVSTGLRLSHEHSQNHQDQFLSSFSMLPGELAGEMKRQRYELDRFIQTQGEELRRTLADNRERRYVELLCVTEELVGRKVREKEVELERATRNWQLRAATREAEVSTLQAHLQQAIASRRETTAKQSTNGGGDGDTEEAVEDAESVYVDPERTEMIGPSCRIFRREYATVIALPC